jgi:hypothetical protein
MCVHDRVGPVDRFTAANGRHHLHEPPPHRSLRAHHRALFSIALIWGCSDAHGPEAAAAGVGSSAGRDAATEPRSSLDAMTSPDQPCSQRAGDTDGRPCPSAREPIDGKLSDSDRQQWQRSVEPQSVLIVVRDGAMLCPPPECPGPERSCPERDRLLARWQAENAVSQRCVRNLVAAVGGEASSESFGFINVFEATLTWSQIQQVAAHPSVQHIDAAQTNTPPP